MFSEQDKDALIDSLGDTVLKEYQNSGYEITTEILRISDAGIQADFKVLTEDEICKMISADSLEPNHPTYLCVRNLIKTGSGDYLNISCLSCLPYGGGGVMGIDILKRNDSFMVTHKGFSNIN